MNITEEKKYLYEMMRSLMEERRTITDIYFSLKKRLEVLEEMETRGLDELSIKGYVDLYNETIKTESLTNVKRELNHISNKLSDTTPTPEANKSVIPAFAIAEQKYHDNKKSPRKSPTSKTEKKGRARSDKTTYIYNLVIEEMKNRKDQSFTAGEVYDLLLAYQQFRDYNINLNTFRSNIFYRIIVNKSKVIKKVGSGKYQYIDI